MRLHSISGIAVAAGLLVATTGAALGQGAPISSGPAIGVGISTLGIIGEVSFRSTRTLVLRINGNWADLGYDEAVDGNAFSGSVKIAGAGLIADWHPFENGFRLSGGVRYHFSEFSGSISGENIEVNGTTYTPAQYGSLVAKVRNGNEIAPYLGFGWDSSHFNSSGFALALDIGALYIGQPKTSLTTSRHVPGLQADLDAEVKKIQDEFGRFGQFWPVISLTAKYRF